MTDNLRSSIPEIDRESLVKQRLPLGGARVIDIGCGEGWLAQLVADESESGIGIDPAKTAIERALAANSSANATYHLASADNLPVEDSWADIVVYYNSLHHVPTELQPKAVKETARVLAPGGLLMIVEPLPSGSAYELFKPVEDEAAVYDTTLQLILGLAAGREFAQDLEELFIDSYVYAGYDEFLDHVVVIDEQRKTVLTDLEEDLCKRFYRLGELVEGGRSYDQVHRLNLLRRL